MVLELTDAEAEAVAEPRRFSVVRAWGPRVVIESALIVFSVLFALVLNEWREDAASRSETRVAAAAIRTEIEENARQVAASAAYHEALVESLLASESEGEPTPSLDDMPNGLFRPARVVSTAWESAQSAELTVGMSYEALLEISSLHAQQAEYVAINGVIAQSIYEQMLVDGFDAMLARYPNFIRVLQDSASREQSLLATYEEALRDLSSSGASSEVAADK